MKQTFLLFIITLLMSCQNEEPEIKSIDNLSDNLKKELDLKNFSNSNIAGNIAVNWNPVNQYTVNDALVYEFAVNEKINSKIKSDFFQEKLNYKLISILKNNTYHNFLIEVYTNKNSPIFKSIQNLNDFTGSLNVYDLRGQNLGQIPLNEGTTTPDFLKSKLEVLKSAIISNYSKSQLSKEPPCYTTQAVFTEHFIEYYNVDTATGAMEYTHTVYTGTSVTYMAVAYPCDSGSGGGIHIVHSVPSYNYYKEFSSITELQNALSNADKNNFNTTLTQQQNQVLATTNFYLLPWTGIKIFIVQNAGQTFTVQSVSSDTWGINAGYSWVQNSYSQNTNGNITAVTLVGTMTYNLAFQGIGNFYSTQITFQININNTTGQIISGTRLP